MPLTTLSGRPAGTWPVNMTLPVTAKLDARMLPACPSAKIVSEPLELFKTSSLHCPPGPRTNEPTTVLLELRSTRPRDTSDARESPLLSTRHSIEPYVESYCDGFD